MLKQYKNKQKNEKAVQVEEYSKFPSNRERWISNSMSSRYHVALTFNKCH